MVDVQEAPVQQKAPVQREAPAPQKVADDAEALKQLQQMLAEQTAEIARMQEKSAQEQQERKDGTNLILGRYYKSEKVNADGHFFLRHFPDAVKNELGEVAKGESPVPEMTKMKPERRAEIRENIKSLHAKEVVESYFDLHSQEYLAQIDRLSGHVPGEKRDKLTQAKVLVTVAARNETELAQVVNALRNSYGNSFNDEVGIVIYHNFSTSIDEIDPEVIRSVKAAGELPNVAVISDQLDKNLRLPEVKKRAADCALRLTQDNPDQTLVFTDADLRMLSANGVQEAQQAIASSDLPFAAVSTVQRPSEEVRLRFPLFYEKKMMDEKAYQALVEDDKKWFAFLGSFGVMTKKTFTGVGGWMPEEIHEDMRFDNQIQLASLCYGSGDTAVVPGSFKHGIVTEFNPDRDLLAIHDQIGGSRFVPELYYKTSGSRRVDWQKIPQSDDPTSLLSGELTARGMLHIAQQYLDSLAYKKPEYAKTAQEAVCRYMMRSGLLTEAVCRGHNAMGEQTAVKITPDTIDQLKGTDIVIEQLVSS